MSDEFNLGDFSGPQPQQKMRIVFINSHVPVWARGFETNRKLFEEEMNEKRDENGQRITDIPDELQPLANAMRRVGRR